MLGNFINFYQIIKLSKAEWQQTDSKNSHYGKRHNTNGHHGNKHHAKNASRLNA